MVKRSILPILIIMVAIALFGAMMSSKVDKPTRGKPEKVWQVQTVPVIFQSVSPELTVYGRIETPHKASLKSAIMADVIETLALEGEYVGSGQTLVILDNTDLEILVEQRQAEVAEIEALIKSEQLRFKRDQELLKNEKKLLILAKNAVARAKKLEKSKLASQANLDDALANQQRQVLTIERLQYDISEHPARLAGLKARLLRVKALLKQAEVDLSRSVVTAPFSGRIVKLDVAKGDRVRVGDALISLYDIANLEVRAQIPNRYIGSIRQQLAKGIKPKATALIENTVFHFTLERFSGEVKQNSGGIEGLFQLTDSVTNLDLGAFVELTLQLEKQDNVVAIPFDALYELDRVYRLHNGYLQSIKIERIGEFTAVSGDKKLLIRSDALTASDRIISTQLPNAITGLRVEDIAEQIDE